MRRLDDLIDELPAHCLPASASAPDFIKLEYNWRSHSGILNLASCVTDLLYKYFPETLDRLPPDLGALPGPKPQLLEAHDHESLSLLLMAGGRSSGHIEFGATQAILVRTEQARRGLGQRRRPA